MQMGTSMYIHDTILVAMETMQNKAQWLPWKLDLIKYNGYYGNQAISATIVTMVTHLSTVPVILKLNLLYWQL